MKTRLDSGWAPALAGAAFWIIAMWPLAVQAQQAPAPDWKSCAREGERCDFRGEAVVRYGAGDKFVTKRVRGGTLCTNAFFGDPSPGVAKACAFDANSRVAALEERFGQSGAAATNVGRLTYEAARTDPATPSPYKTGAARPIYGAPPVAPGPRSPGGSTYQELVLGPRGTYQELVLGPRGTYERVDPSQLRPPSSTYQELQLKPGTQADVAGRPVGGQPRYDVAPPEPAAGTRAVAGQPRYDVAPPEPAGTQPIGSQHRYNTVPLDPGTGTRAVAGQPRYDVVPAEPGAGTRAVAGQPRYDTVPPEPGAGTRAVAGQPRYDTVPPEPGAGTRPVAGQPRYDVVPPEPGRGAPSAGYDKMPVAPQGGASSGSRAADAGPARVGSQPSGYAAPPQVGSQPPGYAAPPRGGSQPPGYAAPPRVSSDVDPADVSGRPASGSSVKSVAAGAVGRAGAGGLLSLGTTALVLGASGQEVKLHDPSKITVRQPVKDLCWLDSYGNGAGEVQSGCAPDREWRDAMCYRKCAADETASMTMCKKSCPDGYRNDPLTCWRDAKVIGADTSACPGYDKCGLTLARGCSKCPAGYTNDGCTCRIDAHAFGRTIRDVGIGLAGSGCRAGVEKDPSGALCYPTCKAGYHIVGPVCWQDTCPADFPVRCAAACAVSQDACALGILSQVKAPFEVVTNIVGAVLTGGGSTVAAAGAKVAVTGAKVAAKAAGQAAIKGALESGAKRAGTELSQQTLSTAASTFASAELTGSFSWYDLDPTGIATVVEAYNKPICKAPPK